MEAHAEHAHHHEMPTEGSALTGLAVSATLHCLTGCAIGEVTGVAVGTALGFSNLATIVLAIVLAFAFGYGLTSLPLLRAGLALAVVIPIALASDTLSIATMEVVDNAIILFVPGAMDAGLDTLLFWGSLAFALVVAFVLTVPVNRWLLARGKGHTAVHNTGIHGGPPIKLVGAAVIVAAVFGTAVLVGEALDGDEMGAHNESSMGMAADEATMSEHAGQAEEGAMSQTTDTTPPGLAVAANGLALELGRGELPQGEEAQLSFQVVGPNGQAITDYDVEHTKRMHLIVVRRDLTGFQHLHPTMGENGIWSTPVTLPDAGSYRVFADFTHEGSAQTLASDLAVDGNADYQSLPFQRTETTTDDGYEVGVRAATARAGAESELAFSVLRNGNPVAVEPYLGAGGHLVALRQGDLAFLHVHPVEFQGGNAIRFMTEFPSEGSYRLFLQFKDRGQVHTAEFTRQVSR
jgi:hypothetical protein